MLSNISRPDIILELKKQLDYGLPDYLDNLIHKKTHTNQCDLIEIPHYYVGELETINYLLMHPELTEKTGFSQYDILQCALYLLEEIFKHLDENSFFPGFDIDGKAVSTTFHFYTNFVVIKTFNILDAFQIDHLKYSEKVLLGAQKMEKIFEPYATKKKPAYRGLNLILMDIATYYEAGIYFKNDNWVSLASLAKERILTRFDIEGFLPDFRSETEDKGPSADYSIYSLFTIFYFVISFPENKIITLISKKLQWLFKTIDPSGYPIDIFDERSRAKHQRYNPNYSVASNSLSPFFPFCPAGREYITNLFNNSNFTFHLHSIINILYLNEILQKDDKFHAILDQKDTQWQTKKKQFSYLYQNKKSGICVNDSWVIAAHCYLGEYINPKELWHRELQQHFSIFHKEIGIIFGGGNSLGQAEFSTLCTKNDYLCSNVEIKELTQNTISLTLSISSAEVEITLQVIDKNNLEINYVILKNLQNEEISAQLNLACFYKRKEIYPSQEQNFSFTEKPICFNSKQLIIQASSHKVSLTSSNHFNYKWPIIPVNVRLPDCPPLSIEDAIGLVKIPLQNTLTLNINIE